MRKYFISSLIWHEKKLDIIVVLPRLIINLWLYGSSFFSNCYVIITYCQYIIFDILNANMIQKKIAFRNPEGKRAKWFSSFAYKLNAACLWLPLINFPNYRAIKKVIIYLVQLTSATLQHRIRTISNTK